MDAGYYSLFAFWLGGAGKPKLRGPVGWLCGTVTLTEAVAGEVDAAPAIDGDVTLYPQGCEQ
jgi:hypothetical protein